MLQVYLFITSLFFVMYIEPLTDIGPIKPYFVFVCTAKTLFDFPFLQYYMKG